MDAIQIFDSMGGMLSSEEYSEVSGHWIGQIIESLEGVVPVILFSRDTAGSLQELVQTGAQVLGLDWSIRLSEARSRIPSSIALQGNLDPTVLKTTPEIAARETSRILE